MKFPLFTDEDKHPYLWWSLTLIILANIIIHLDPKLSRSFSVAGNIMNLAGAYWIAAGVVLRISKTNNDHERANIDTTSEIIPNMLKIQSRRAKFGTFWMLVGTVGQIVSAYIT